MKDLGLINKFLGIEINQKPNGIYFHQTTYIHTILDRYRHLKLPTSSVPLDPATKLRANTQVLPMELTEYQTLVSQLIFLTKARPDIYFATSLLSRFMHYPQVDHWNATLHLLSYLTKNPSLGLWYPKGEESTIQGFLDANYAGNLDDCTSYLFLSGSTPISWSSKKQTSTSRSSYKSEYSTLAKCTYDAIWLKRLEKN